MVEVLQPCAPPGARAVPVDPEQSLPRSFPGGPAAVGDAASIFEGLELTAGDEHSSSVARARKEHNSPGVGVGPAGADKCRYVWSHI